MSERADHQRAALSRRLGHEFANADLLKVALTHRSAGGGDNERLEFLGDSVLNMVIAHALFEARPHAPEGDLSRLRASLVRERTLAEVATELELGPCLQMGQGERRSGGARRASVQADALEAVIGAVFQDAGFEAAAALVRRLFADRLAELPSADSLKDAKTRLQEYLQGRGRELPRYEIVSTSGVDHERHFVARCSLADAPQTADGEGSGRRRAEQAAARAMLAKLESGHE